MLKARPVPHPSRSADPRALRPVLHSSFGAPPQTRGPSRTAAQKRRVMPAGEHGGISSRGGWKKKRKRNTAQKLPRGNGLSCSNRYRFTGIPSADRVIGFIERLLQTRIVRFFHFFFMLYYFTSPKKRTSPAGLNTRDTRAITNRWFSRTD